MRLSLRSKTSLRQAASEAEMDEMWSFVGKKGNPRWLWHAIGAPCKRYGGMWQDLGVYRYPLSRWG
jgi:hypothetical protein